MKILLLGKSGQLGYELERCLAPLGDVVAPDRSALDLTDLPALRETVLATRPLIIVNAAAYTAVDRAEQEPETAHAVNALAPAALAQAARDSEALLIHFSTDYVFNGEKGRPYTEQDTPNPVNIYGSSKLEGEQAIQQVGGAFLILRTAWVYSLRRDSFVTKVLRWARAHQVLRIVEDQVGSPTWSRALAQVVANLICTADTHGVDWLRSRSGLYHLAGWGMASRIDWARAILEFDPQREAQIAREVLPARTADFPTPATRPLYTALDCSRFEATFDLRLPPWQEALRLALAP